MEEEFLELFKKFENLTRLKYKSIKPEITMDDLNTKSIKDIVYILGNKKIYPYSKHYNLIYYCIDIRNIYSHKNKINNEYAVTPNKHLVNELKKIISAVENPPKVLSIAVPKEKIFKKNIDESIKETIKIMNEKTYTHIPILDNEKFVGVFSENAIFNYINSEKITSIDEKTNFKAMEKYLNINNQTEEIIFIKKTMLIEEVINIFKEKFSKEEKLSCIFITETGKETSEILGMITAWDIIGNYM